MIPLIILRLPIIRRRDHRIPFVGVSYANYNNLCQDCACAPGPRDGCQRISPNEFSQWLFSQQRSPRQHCPVVTVSPRSDAPKTVDESGRTASGSSLASVGSFEPIHSNAAGFAGNCLDASPRPFDSAAKPQSYGRLLSVSFGHLRNAACIEPIPCTCQCVHQPSRPVLR